MIKYQDGSSTTVYPWDLDASKFYPYYPGIQAQIDISKYIKDNSIEMIGFYLKKSMNYSIEIELDDDNWDTVRPLYKRRVRQKGAKIRLEKSETKVGKSYYTTIRQTVHEEDDKSFNCKIYPNEEFASYKDCDMAFTRQAYQAFYHQKGCGRGQNISTENIVPIYATRNFDEVTKLIYADCTNTLFFPHNLVTGATSSPCFVPCTTTFTDTMETSIEEWKQDGEFVSIIFDNTVVVTRITVDNFQIMESLNFLGSNLGLWPGLGIFQLIQWSFKNIALGTLFQKCIRRENTQKTN